MGDGQTQSLFSRIYESLFQFDLSEGNSFMAHGV